MKTQKFIFMIFTCFGLLMGCSNEEALDIEQGEINLKKATKSAVFVVEPNGFDDTENLKKAFADAMAAGQGTVVQLTEGDFFIDLIEVREFHGTLKGAGKGKTIISTIADLSVDDFINQNLDVFLLSFVGGDVCVRGLTIHTPQGPLSSGSIDKLYGQLGFCAVTAQYIAENEHINAVVDNVEFITQGYTDVGLIVDSGFWHNIPGGVPLADIDISVTNCSFSGPYSWEYGVLLMEIREGNIVVGSKSNGNKFNNCDLGIWHNVNIKATVHSNIFIRKNGWFPLQVINSPWREDPSQFPQTFQSVYNIEKNTFNVSESAGVVLINDNRRFSPSYEIPMLVQVKNNKIHTEGNMFTAMGCLNLSGTVIRNNKFTGEAEYGVRIFSQWPEGLLAENGLLLGNNFSNSKYSLTTVLLGNGTKDWTIVGGNLGESVWDWGENNIITGFNNNTSDAPLGQAIVDNLEEMKNALKNLDDR